MTKIVLEWHNEVGDKIIEKEMKRLQAAAMEIKGESQALCPVDTGTLRNSAYINDLDNGYEIGYGGAASDYALEQHENLQYYHPVGQAKFLEMAFINVTNSWKSGERTVISTWGDTTSMDYGSFNTE